MPKSSARLSQVLGQTPRGGFRTLAALPGNIKAIEAALQFAHGVQPFVVVVGPSGWGKTHLMVSTSEVLADSASVPEITSALDWIMNPTRNDSSAPLLLDDVQDVLRHPRARHQFRLALERRIRSRRPTMICFNGHRVSHSLRTFLPLSREWTVALITEPTPDERELVVRQIASSEQMLLSKSIVRLISRHLHGNGRSVSGALQRLKMFRDDWSSADDVCQACGVLMPYLLGRDGWDPRDEVHEAVTRALANSATDPNLVTDVSAYILRQLVGLTEGDVATFLKITPSNVYNRSNQVKSRLNDPDFATLFSACKSAVLQNFERV